VKQRAAFRRREAAPIAIDVDALGVETLYRFGAVRVEHRDVHQRAAGEDVCRLSVARILQQVAYQVEHDGRVSGLVAMHLRPEKDALGPRTDFREIDGAAFYGLGELLDSEPAVGLGGQFIDDPLHIAGAKRGGVVGGDAESVVFFLIEQDGT